MIFECNDFKSPSCPLRGQIVMACHKHSDDPIFHGAEIRCWVDDHGIIITELQKKVEKSGSDVLEMGAI